jgi:hypothetical protein
MKYKFVEWKVVAIADNKDPKNLRLMWELGVKFASLLMLSTLCFSLNDKLTLHSYVFLWQEKAEAQLTRPLLEGAARVPPPMYTPPSTPVDNDDGISNDGGFQFFSSVSFFSYSLQGSVTGRQKLRYFLLENTFF